MKKTLYACYEAAGILVLPLLLLLYRKRIFGPDGNWPERFGCLRLPPEPFRATGKNIWVHAVSLGEILAASPLIHRIQKSFPENRLILTCSSISGRNLAKKRFPDVNVSFLPLDLSLLMKKTVRLFNPALFIFLETELWPNLLKYLKAKKCPAVLVNGRISPASFRLYKKFKFFFKMVLDDVDLLLMRSRADAERLLALGAAKEKIRTGRSLKFDNAFSLSLANPPEYKIPAGKKIVVLGSIHPGEEPGTAEIIRNVSAQYNDVSFVIAPRALDKTKIFPLLSEKKLRYRRFSEWKGEDFTILVLDVYGELVNFYRLCEFAFAGGSLVPAGGQNPIEPLAFKKPVLLGRHNWDFSAEWPLIKSAGAGIEVRDFRELEEKIFYLLGHPETAQKMGENGYAVILANKGAAQETIRLIKSLPSSFRLGYSKAISKGESP